MQSRRSPREHIQTLFQRVNPGAGLTLRKSLTMKDSPLPYVRRSFLAFVFCLTFGGLLPLNAQLITQLEVQSLPDITIDATNFPHVSARIRANYNGSAYALSTNEILIQEDNRTTRPQSVSAPNGAGFQTIEWLSTLRGVQRDPSSTVENPVGFNPATIYVIVDGQVSREQALQRRYDPPLVRFLALDPELTDVLPDVHFGTVAPGQDSVVSVYVQLQSAERVNDRELPITVDSVSISGDQFSWKWMGAAIDRNDQFPITIVSPFRYRIEVTFSPTSSNYVYDTLTVYYDGGATRSAYLIGNLFEVPDISPLQMISPVGGAIFAPCEDIEIEWEGATPNLPVTVEFSPDAGRNWQVIGETTESSLLWRLPTEGSEQVRFRVTQPLQASETKTLQEQGAPIGNIGFSNDSKALLSADQSGVIRTWDVASAAAGFVYTVPGSRPNTQPYEALAVNYISDTQFAAVFKNIIALRDSMYIFTVGQAEPVAQFGLPSTFPVSSVDIDVQGRFVAFGSDRSAEMVIVNLPDLSQRTVRFDAPVTGITLSGKQEKAVVSGLDGQLHLFDLPEFTRTGTIDLAHFQTINQLELSADGRFIAVATKAPRVTQQGGGRAAVHIIDVASGQTIRSFRRSSTDAVGFTFSSTARFLAIGFEGAPQTRIYNLPSDRDEGSIISHPGALTDIEFASDGFSIASSALTTIQNLKLRTFAFPERDSNDTFIRIVPPTVRLAAPVLPDALIGASEPVTISTAICNDGETALDLDNLFLATGLMFRLANDFVRDTLEPGECRDVELIFNPSDTGSIRDLLVFQSCEREFVIPLEARSQNRNIALLAADYDFGELCVGEERTVEIDLIRNDDDRPLLVNSIFIEDIATSPFVFAEVISDTLLLPGETLRARIRFSPLDLGFEDRIVTVEHSDQRQVFAEFDFRGVGVGAELDYSHETLTFIPELRTRTVRITNNSANPVQINDVQSADPGVYRVTSSFPATIGPGESAEVQVEYLGPDAPIANSELRISSEPCSGTRSVVLGAYRATSLVEVPTVEADPTEPTTIPITFKNNENVAYDGPRSFEAQIRLNQRLFLPQSVESDFGEAEIWRNDVEGDWRIIGIRVTGNFGAEGVVVNIHGLPGLAETLTTPIEFVEESLYWSSAVTTLGSAGELIITPEDPTRRLIKRSALMTVTGVFPNPASGAATVEVNSSESARVQMVIVDMLGNQVAGLPPIDVPEGSSRHIIDVNAVPVGAYRIVLQAASDIASSPLLIAR